MAERVGASLGLFAGVRVPAWRNGDRTAWQLRRVGQLLPRAQRNRSPMLHSCLPGLLPGDIVVQVHGWIDNLEELADSLGCSPDDPVLVYGYAVRAWKDKADAKIQGDYCAVYDDPASSAVRLARSAHGAPPLYYFHRDGQIGVASVPRVLEAMGLERAINRKRVADSLYFNLTDPESYLMGSYRVPYGAAVYVNKETRRTVRYYDALAVAKQPKASPQEYLEEADRLLSEAAGLYLRSGNRTGVLLSAGLDSSNLAARLTKHLAPGEKLHSFTYVPLEGHGQTDIPGALIDEGPAVRAFVAMYPQIVPHFTDNRGIEFDHRLDEMFLAMGTGSVNLATFFRYHGLYAAACGAGCDMILSADFGNCSFSTSGTWAFAEYLRKGRLVQLWRALRGDKLHPRSLAGRFVSRAVMPMLPDPLWRMSMRLWGKHQQAINTRNSALSSSALDEFDVQQRAIDAGTQFERPLYGWREQLISDNFSRGDVEGSDLLQGWEQLYEVSCRDPTSYRPLVDFCLGLPTDMFMRDGQTRWLARQLGRGIMPEAQRTMLGHGQHNSDWHKRLTPRVAEMRRMVKDISHDPVLGDMIDTEQLEHDLDNWPTTQTLADDVYFPHAFRLPRAIAMARYIRFMTNRNTP